MFVDTNLEILSLAVLPAEEAAGVKTFALAKPMGVPPALLMQV